MRKLSFIIVLLFTSVTLISAAEPVFKSFNINGEVMERWVTVTEKEYVYDDEGLLQTLYEYDEYRDTMYNLTSYLYDSRGNCIKETDGTYYTFSLPGRDNLSIYYQTWYEYDSQNRLIHKICDDSFSYWYEYDSEGRLYKEQFVSENSWTAISYYNDDNQESFVELDNGTTYTYEYENGNLVHVISSDDAETWYEYDERGNQVFIKSSMGYERTSVYDDNNDLIFSSTKSGTSMTEYFYEYEYNEDGLLVREFEYKRM